MSQTDQITQALGGAMDLKRLIKEAAREARKSRIPIFIATLAAFLALASMANGNADKVALQSHIKAANQFAYFQAKNIRMTDTEIAAATFGAMGKPDLAAKWQAKADRYRAEKAVILKEARNQQDLRKAAITKGRYYTVAVSLLQIAIVLASASLILGGGYLFGGSVFLALIATAYLVNGYGFYYEVPTGPTEFYNWMVSAKSVAMNW